VDEANTLQPHTSCDAAERAWLAMIARGEQSALLALYQRYQRPLLVYVLRLVGDASLAEEVLQDVLVAIWQGTGGIEYRVVGEARPEDEAVPVAPGMEDGYLWLMAGMGAKEPS
jgi:hypothetical protein